MNVAGGRSVFYAWFLRLSPGSKEEVGRLTREPSWQVLLIGGNSGAGKTTVARELGLHFEIPWLQVDDLRLMLEWNTEPVQRPALHHFDDQAHVYQHPADVITAWRIAMAEDTSRGIEIVIANHVSGRVPIVLEGDDIVPGLAAQRTFAQFDIPVGAVHSIFVIEDDEAIIMANLRRRGRGFGFSSRTPDEQANQVRVSRLYGEWLEQEARRHRLPVVTARPYDGLARRVIGILG